MSKILKNNTISIVDIDDVGLSIPASDQLIINPVDYDDFAASDDIVRLIGAETITVNNGSSDLSISEGIRLVQGGFTNKIQLDNDLITSDRVKVDVTGTLGDGQVKVSSNDGTTAFLKDKIASVNNKILITEVNDGMDEDLQIELQPSNINTSELTNDANFIDSASAPVQPSDIANFETSTQLDSRDTNNRNRANHTGTQTASTISDFNSAVQFAETDTTISFNNTTKVLSYTNEAGTTTDVDLTQFLDDTNLARIVSGTLDPVTGIATFTRDDATTFTIDFSSLNDQAAISLAISTHETSITNHDDVNTAGAANGDLLEYNGTNWVPNNSFFKDHARNTTGLINQTTLYQQYLRLSTIVPTTAEYKISWSYVWSVNSTSDDFEARIQLDDSTTIVEQIQEAKDSAGTGVTLSNTSGGTANSGTSQRYITSGFDIVTLSSGAHNIDLDFTGNVSNIEPAIYKACITIERWS